MCAVFRLRLLVVLSLAGTSGASAPLLAALPDAPARPEPVPRASVNGPCRVPDLMVGAPYATVAGRFRAGRVAIQYAGRQIAWLEQHQPSANAGFGAALASGDFDGDPCADLAVGIPDQMFGARRRAGAEGHGAVQIFHGSREGLRRGRLLSVRDLRRPHGTDRFGAALTAADLDDDGDDELVVGAPGLSKGGGVAVFGMRGRGLRPGPLITQRTAWVGQSASETDGFGTVLTAGNFDDGGGAEIAVGAPGDGPKSEGAVTVLDPLARTSGHLTQASAGIEGDPERLDHFGAALAAGDFDRDGRDDLAIGTPSEDGGGPADVGNSEGAVQVVDGVSLRQIGGTWRGRGGKGRYDRFGAALAAGDLTGDGTDDLAVGAPGGGAVSVLRGDRGEGLTGRKTRTIGSPLGPDGQFGWSLSVRRGDLLVGAPGAAGFGGAIALVPRLSQDASRIPVPASGLLGYSLG